MKQGEQILLSYGKKSNANFLLHYGFAYANNPYDYVEIQVEADDYYYLQRDKLNTNLVRKLKKGQDRLSELKAIFVYKELC